MICPECGEALGDFTPCVCALDARPKPLRHGGMTGMIARRLEGYVIPDANRLALRAGMAVETTKRWLAGGPVRSATAEKLAQVAAELGVKRAPKDLQ